MVPFSLGQGLLDDSQQQQQQQNYHHHSVPESGTTVAGKMVASPHFRARWCGSASPGISWKQLIELVAMWALWGDSAGSWLEPNPQLIQDESR